MLEPLESNFNSAATQTIFPEEEHPVNVSGFAARNDETGVQPWVVANLQLLMDLMVFPTVIGRAASSAQRTLWKSEISRLGPMAHSVVVFFFNNCLITVNFGF